ncbi:unnamed protein product [Dovyalis caffra]|uniref:Uncharacterized protein n=1 Tax=Dovyalis caffra TaxID=77055 RepID=A0AAV1RKV0_9ROSI|nr:unnamed protein product [Dovyalis caffra]
MDDSRERVDMVGSCGVGRVKQSRWWHAAATKTKDLVERDSTIELQVHLILAQGRPNSAHTRNIDCMEEIEKVLPT